MPSDPNVELVLTRAKAEERKYDWLGAVKFYERARMTTYLKQHGIEVKT